MTNAGSWLEIQRRLVSGDLVAEIDIETITYTRIGGYKATPYSVELGLPTLLTAKSIKGVWRWWARAAVVGAKGGRINYLEANRFINKLLGGTGEVEGASHYRLEVLDSYPETSSDKGKTAEPLSGKRGEETIIELIDRFYDDVKRFVNLHWSRVKEIVGRIDVEMKIRVNPSNPLLTIKTKPYVDRRKIEGVIRNSPLGPYIDRINTKDGELRVVLRIDSRLEDYVRIPRVKLVLMKREDEEDEIRIASDLSRVEKYIERVKEELTSILTKGWRFKVLLYRDRGSSESDLFAVSTLILSLILGGIGSMTRRGFGSLRINSVKLGAGCGVKGSDLLVETLTSLGIRVEAGGKVHLPRRLDEAQIKEQLKKLINYAIKSAKCLPNWVEDAPGGSREGPTKVPSLSNIEINVIKCRNPRLDKIGEAFLKQKWREKLQKMNKLKPGNEIHTWVLGLPRSQARDGTGYFVKKDSEREAGRRVSAIGVRLFKISDNEDYVVVYGFESEDWPEKLIHFRKPRGSKKPIDTVIEARKNVAYAYREAFEIIRDLIIDACRDQYAQRSR